MYLNIDNNDYEVVIIRKNNKRTYIRVKEDLKIYVYTNKYALKFEINKMLKDNADSIRDMIERIKNRISNSDKTMYLGDEVDIITVSNQKEPEVYNNKMYIKDINKLDNYYKIFALSVFSERLNILYSRFTDDIPYPVLKVRKMNSRHGVCNRKNKTITINSELIKRDIKYIDYVIIHELCHFICFNHSSDFWSYVFKYCPDYKKINKDMKEW